MSIESASVFVIVDISNENEVVRKSGDRDYLDYLINRNPTLSYYWRVREVVSEQETRYTVQDLIEAGIKIPLSMCTN